MGIEHDTILRTFDRITFGRAHLRAALAQIAEADQRSTPSLNMNPEMNSCILAARQAVEHTDTMLAAIDATYKITQPKKGANYRDHSHDK